MQLFPVPPSFPCRSTAHLGNMKNVVESIPLSYSGGVRLFVRWKVIEILWLHFKLLKTENCQLHSTENSAVSWQNILEPIILLLLIMHF